MSDECDFIEVRFVGGKTLRAKGKHAKEVWEWLQSGETMTYIHGGRYKGEPMKEIAKENEHEPISSN